MQESSQSHADGAAAGEATLVPVAAPSLHSRPYAKHSAPRASHLSVRPFCRRLAGNSTAGRTTSLVQLPKSVECIERFERAVGRQRSITAQRRQFRVDSQHRQ